MALVEANGNGAGEWYFSPEGEKEAAAAMSFAGLVGGDKLTCEFCGCNITPQPALLSVRVENPKGKVAIRTGDLCVTCVKCGKRTMLPGMMTLEAYPSIVGALRGKSVARPAVKRSPSPEALRNNPYYRKAVK